MRTIYTLVILCMVFHHTHHVLGQNLSYKVYEASENKLTSDKITNLFIVPEGILVLFKTEDGAVFNLYDKELNLKKSTPLTSDVGREANLSSKYVYKLKDKIIAESWGMSSIVSEHNSSRKCIILEYDLTGKFHRSIRPEPLPTNYEQDFYYSQDSSKILYLASCYAKAARYVIIGGMPPEERLLCFRIYDNNFKELDAQNLLLKELTFEKKENIYLMNISIQNNGDINFLYQKNVSSFIPLSPIYFFTYNFEKKKIDYKKVATALPEGATLEGAVSLDFDGLHSMLLSANKYTTKDDPTANNYYFILKNGLTNDLNEISKAPKWYRRFMIGSSKFETDKDTTYDGHSISFDSKVQTKDGAFLIQTKYDGSSIDIQDDILAKYSLFCAFIGKDLKLKFIKNVEPKLAPNESYIYSHKHFLYRDKLIVCYFKLRKDKDSKSSTVAGYNLIPTLAVVDSDGNISKHEFAKELPIDLSNISNFYEIGDGKYLMVLKKLNKYTVLTLDS